MTNNEFKAWFEGFCESIDGRPTVKQFDKIKAKISEIDGNPVYHWHPPIWYADQTPALALYTTSNYATTVSALMDHISENSASAYEAGKMDFNSIS